MFHPWTVRTVLGIAILALRANAMPLETAPNSQMGMSPIFNGSPTNVIQNSIDAPASDKSERLIESRDTASSVANKNGTDNTATAFGDCGVAPPGSTKMNTNYALKITGYWHPSSTTLCFDAWASNDAKVMHFKNNYFIYPQSFFVPIISGLYDLAVEFWFRSLLEMNDEFWMGISGTIDRVPYHRDWTIKRTPQVLLNSVASEPSPSPQNIQLSRRTSPDLHNTAVVAGFTTGECGIDTPSATLINSYYAFRMEGFWNPLSQNLCVDAFFPNKSSLAHFSVKPFDYNNGQAYQLDIVKPEYHVQVQFQFASEADVGRTFDYDITGTINGLLYSKSFSIKREWPKLSEDATYKDRRNYQSVRRDTLSQPSNLTNSTIDVLASPPFEDCGEPPPDTTHIDSNIGFKMTGFWDPAFTTMCIDAFNTDGKTKIGHYLTRSFTYANTPITFIIKTKRVYHVSLIFYFLEEKDVEWLFHVSLVGTILEKGEPRQYDEDWEIVRQSVPALGGGTEQTSPSVQISRRDLRPSKRGNGVSFAQGADGAAAAGSGTARNRLG
ncbi:uncharacterized protein KY384_005598 [Bacidia gigantensis]|uniref:uncharacterized protein n=1 Tax=Bacidia gigantensis TaxID=2732470 RepID=UPI001D056ED4|nr:uncharacterized protein KY384_005598 [Bacidia gigantensis]KAG8530116.1 hypothetical protein KY384_005598 [Bacidia gigantensis]